MEVSEFKENVILVDADYADAVAGNLIATFGEKLGRPIPAADLAEWLVCCALDGGITAGDNQIQVIFVRSAEKKILQNFNPSNLDDQLNGQAFRDEQIGEFLLSTISEETVNHGEPLVAQCLQTLLDDRHVKNLIAVLDMAPFRDIVKQSQTQCTEKAITILCMSPDNTLHFRQEIVGFSLMHAMGIRADEIR